MQPQPMQMGGGKNKKIQKYTLSLDKNFFFWREVMVKK
jgi:hypothetical protein